MQEVRIDTVKSGNRATWLHQSPEDPESSLKKRTRLEVLVFTQGKANWEQAVDRSGAESVGAVGGTSDFSGNAESEDLRELITLRNGAELREWSFEFELEECGAGGRELAS